MTAAPKTKLNLGDVKSEIPVTSILLQAGKFALNTCWQQGKLLEASLTRRGAPNAWLFYTQNEAELIEFLGMCSDLQDAIFAHKAAPPPPKVKIEPPPHNDPLVIRKPTGDAKQQLLTLYRELAKRFHPDLAVSDEDRDWRTQRMAEANAAYEAGDLEMLKQLAGLPFFSEDSSEES